MATTTDHESPSPDHAEGGSGPSTVERLERLLEEWRARIDELLVQADLASKDVAEAVRSQAAIAENAYLAAKSRLRQIPKDAGAGVDSARAGVEKLVGDIRNAYESAEAVIRRGPSD